MKRTRTFGGLVLILLVSLAWTEPSHGDDRAKRPEASKLDELIHQLGDDDFHVRDKASRELLRIGVPASEALLRGVRDPDLEIRRRCRELLPAIAEAERQAKIAAF